MVESGAINPARAPASIDMLQTVMRASMLRSRIAWPVYSMTWPVPPAVPISPMMARIKSLEPTPKPSSPSTAMRRFRGRLSSRVWVASTCSTSEVPMPMAKQAKAPWVAVCESPHTRVVPGRVKPCSGPMIWTMPWRASVMSNSSTSNAPQLALRASTWMRASSSSMPCERSVVGTL